eukprot:2117783-Prymnesium_polylepis.1
MGRLLLWSANTGPGEPGGGGISESRDVRPGACFTVQGRRCAVHDGPCAHRMLWLSVFSCGAQFKKEFKKEDDDFLDKLHREYGVGV